MMWQIDDEPKKTPLKMTWQVFECLLSTACTKNLTPLGRSKRCSRANKTPFGHVWFKMPFQSQQSNPKLLQVHLPCSANKTIVDGIDGSTLVYKATTARTRRSRELFANFSQPFCEVFARFSKISGVFGPARTYSNALGCIRMHSDAFRHI